MNKMRQINPPPELEQTILTTLYKKERRTALIRGISTGCIAIISCISSIPAIMYLIKSVTSSGFFDYISLLSSDGSSVISYWKEFSMSLAESIPIFGLTLCLILLALFIWSLSKTTKNVRIALAFN